MQLQFWRVFMGGWYWWRGLTRKRKKILGHWFSGGDYVYTPPTPSPISGQKAFSRGVGWGCIFWGPARQEFYAPPPPPFYTPPSPRTVFKIIFRGGGGVGGVYPLIQNDYRQEKIIFELFSGALQENPVRAPGAITGGALTGQGPIQETIFGELPPGTKPIHAGKNSWGINFCANTCGACIRMSANTGKYIWGIIFENMYSHFGPCPLNWYSACIRTSLVPIHKNILEELISVQIHAAHVFTPGRIQENISGELFMYWFRARGYFRGLYRKIL